MKGDFLVRRIYIVFLSLLFFSVSLIVIPSVSLAKVSNPPPKETVGGEWIDIKRLGPKSGIIMNDRPKRPSSWSDARNMGTFGEYYEDDGHTGWSVLARTCVSQGSGDNVNYYYEEDARYSTDNRSDNGDLSQYKGQLASKYPNLVENWDGVRGSLYGVDAWNIYHVDTFKPCNKDSLGFQTYMYGDNEILMEGRVQVSVDDPSDSHESEGVDPEGSAGGRFIWYLGLDRQGEPSVVHVENSARIESKHFATRDLKWRVDGIESSSPIQFTEPPGSKASKNFSFSYEYTNHYKDIYRCVDQENGYCYKYQFVERVPDWDQKKKFEISTSLQVDHSYGETFDMGDNNGEVELVTGRSATITKSTFVYGVSKERIKVDLSDVQKETQTWNEVKEDTKLTFIGSNNGQPIVNSLYGRYGGYFFPEALDENLEELFQNRTGHTEFTYVIPLKLSNRSQVLQSRFYLTDRKGFIVFLDDEKDWGNARLMNEYAKRQYEAYTNQGYRDDIIISNDSSKGSKWYFPVIATDSQKEYIHGFFIDGVGFNQIKMNYKRNYSFKRYLYGHVKDDPVFLTQRTSVNRTETYRNSFQMNRSQIDAFKAYEMERRNRPLLHKFKQTDDIEESKRVRMIVPTIPIH